jgi:hypothetical protein
MLFTTRAGSSEYELSISDFWTTNEWIHVVCTVGGSTMACYKNGALVDSSYSTTSGGEATYATRSYHYIGAQCAGCETTYNRYLDGTIAYLKFWQGTVVSLSEFIYSHSHLSVAFARRPITSCFATDTSVYDSLFFLIYAISINSNE